VDRTAAAADITSAFCERTGVTSGAPPRRNLWMDAFAVCNCIALHGRMGSGQWFESARTLIRQVHRVLGTVLQTDRPPCYRSRSALIFV
jgi:hypothetical protein